MGGAGRVVEIDESKFMHRGAYREGHWVLGMVERGSNLCMMVAVESRAADVLLPIIVNMFYLALVSLLMVGQRIINSRNTKL